MLEPYPWIARNLNLCFLLVCDRNKCSSISFRTWICASHTFHSGAAGYIHLLLFPSCCSLFFFSYSQLSFLLLLLLLFLWMFLIETPSFKKYSFFLLGSFEFCDFFLADYIYAKVSCMSKRARSSSQSRSLTRFLSHPVNYLSIFLFAHAIYCGFRVPEMVIICSITSP